MDFAKLLESLSVDVLYVSNPHNVRYLSGFVEGKDAKLVITPEGPVLITDGRYLVEASKQPFPYRILQRRNELGKLLSEFFRGRVGFEAEHLSVAALESFKKEFPGLEFVPTQGVFERMRQRKRPPELERIRKAAALTDRGFQHILSYLSPACAEIGSSLGAGVLPAREGSEGVAFSITVASGERGAQPHGGATQRAIQAGELVTLDFGAVVEGYCSDMTRTVAVGQPSEELHELYQAVLEAQQKALEAVAPGRRGAELDALARDHLEQRGYGAYFTHSLGHGVGLYIHEGPSLSQTSEDVLEPDQVITIEPGVYIPGKGGCRIEDLVRVTDGGFELLSQSPKELMVL